MQVLFKKKNLVAFILSALGTCFLINYIFTASVDVVSSDYIRIINYYLPDVSDIHFLLSWEGISRIPFAFLARFINKEYFHYSVYFDKILGVFGLFLFNFVTVRFVFDTLINSYIKIFTSILVTIISFSLISWEMILNGTGYAHFLTTGLITVILYLYDKQVKKDFLASSEKSLKDNFALQIILYILIIVTSLIFAGQYAVGYLSTIIFVSCIMLFIYYVRGKKNVRKGTAIFYILSVLISIVCILCFLKSNNTGEAVTPVGMKDIDIFTLLAEDPTFPIRFILKGLASAIIGVETLDYATLFGTINEKMIYLLGIIYLFIIIFALILFFKKAIKKDIKTVFPYMYVLLGLANFMLIFLARYKFVDDTYGMSSRYGIQYMFLTVGLIILFMMTIDDVLTKKKYAKIDVCICILAFLSILIFATGHLSTTAEELYKVPLRKVTYINAYNIAKNYRDFSEEELMTCFEYRRGGDLVVKALKTLEDNNLNVFYKK